MTGIKTAAFDLDVKAVEDDGRFKGYGSVFGAVDSYQEIVAPGAFNASLATLAAKGRKLPVLWQHRSGEPLGVYDVLREDVKGLYVEGRLLKQVERAREAHALLEAGAVTGLSIGYLIKADSLDQQTGVRILTDVDLKEVSLVTLPANDEARVMRAEAVETERDFERLLRDAGFSRAASSRLAKGGWGALAGDAPSAPSRDPDLAQRVLAAAQSLRSL